MDDFVSDVILTSIYVAASPIILPMFIIVGPFVLLKRYLQARRVNRKLAEMQARDAARMSKSLWEQATTRERF